MASHINEEYLHLTSANYQELVHRVTRDSLWPQYFLLINACLENIKCLPITPEQYDQADVERLLIESLERLAEVITILLPGGMEEFQSYLKKATSQQRH